MSNAFLEIGSVLALATFLAVAARLLKQPLILAYIVAGLFIGPLSIFKVGSGETLSFLSELGIALLLFLVGLELSVTHFKSFGREVLWGGFVQVGITALLALVLSLILGFGLLPSIYLAVSLTFSSTIIIVKLLSEKNDINTLFGRISVGILLIQDLVALVILIFLSGVEGGGKVGLFTFPIIFLKGVLLVYLTMLFSKKIIPPLFSFFSRNTELLFLGSISWCFIVASFAQILGFSLEIGSFLAGLALAATNLNWQIAAKIKPLRDLFIIIFFILLGSKMNISSVSGMVLSAIFLSVFVIIAKPLIMMIIMRGLNFRKRTSFLTSLTLSQVSEFSLILSALGLKLGHINDQIVGLFTLVTIITISVSSYMIANSKKLYSRLEPLLDFVEKDGVKEVFQLDKEETADHVVLVGCKRMGYSLLKIFKKQKTSFVVLDFDPEVIRVLQSKGVKAYFGDASDPEMLTHLNIPRARMVVSTIEKVEDSLNLLKDIRLINPRIIMILTANEETDALSLYSQGADYVIIPKISGGEHVANLISDRLIEKVDLRKHRQKEIEELQERLLDRQIKK